MIRQTIIIMLHRHSYIMYYYCYIRSHELIATAPVRTQYAYLYAYYNRRPSPYAIGTMGRFLRWTMRRRFTQHALQTAVCRYSFIVSHLSNKLSWPESYLTWGPTCYSQMHMIIIIILLHLLLLWQINKVPHHQVAYYTGRLFFITNQPITQKNVE